MVCNFEWNLFEKFTYAVVIGTELFFYRLGITIAKHPIRTIVLCWIVVALSALGLFRFRQEKNPLKLWVPPHTTFIKDSEWLMRTFQRGFSDQSILIVDDDDVLRPDVILRVAELHNQIMSARTPINNISMKDVCFKIPKVNKKLLKLLINDDDKEETKDPSMNMSIDLYCSFIEAMKSECYTKSILELWDFNMTKISQLTKADIIEAINSYDKRLIFGKLQSYEELLGGITRNETGHIIKATAIENDWLLLVNFSAIDMDKSGNLAGTAEWATQDALEWESTFLNIMENISEYDKNFYYVSARSFGDLSRDSMFQDMGKLSFGVILMIIYVQFVISKFNWVEVRSVLGLFGLLVILMGFIVGIGICSLFGIFYGPVHLSLPFLLMGLGVDDILVIITCWNELNDKEKHLPLPERIGLMLKHAGVSITITSFTDVIAFIIGSSTILPCLESFCIYAAVAVSMTFVFVITFFTACFVLDQKRLEMSRNGIIPFIEHKNYKPNNCSQVNYTNKIFHYLYSNYILTTPGKIIVLLVTLISLGFGITNALKLEQLFDPKWFLQGDNHLIDFMNAKDFYYPDYGYETGLYVGNLNYSKELTKINFAVNQLENMNTTKNLMSWIKPFRTFTLNNFNHDIFEEDLTDDQFNVFLSRFLFSPYYAKYQANFVFEKPLECGMPAPNIKISSVDFILKDLNDPRNHIEPMHQMQLIATDMNLTTGEKLAFVWSKHFSLWITDELIGVEVSRNLQLALLCVMACTILLIANWQTCFWIFLCVLFTMIDICGFMQRWGLTIDLVSCIALELAIGLSVDYATHVAHTFLTIREGSRQERTIQTVTSIGSAVFYGGLSTLIGIFMMSQSNAYTFQIFFKIFLLVIIFGLFHGIILLPVILSCIGPNPYEMKINLVSQSDHDDHEENIDRVAMDSTELGKL